MGLPGAKLWLMLGVPQSLTVPPVPVGETDDFTSAAARRIAAAAQLARRVQETNLSHVRPRAFRGWAEGSFAIVPGVHPSSTPMKPGLAYLLMPKSGSTSIREVLHRDYGMKLDMSEPASLKPRNTYRPGKLGGANASEVRSRYRFTFVVEPAGHLIKGICQGGSTPIRRLCHGAVKADGHILPHLVPQVERVVADIRDALDGRKEGLDSHLAPQSWILRRSRLDPDLIAVGAHYLDYVAPLSGQGWADLRIALLSRGLHALGPLVRERPDGFSSLTEGLFRSMSPRMRAVACDMVVEEQAIFAIDWPGPNRVRRLCHP